MPVCLSVKSPAFSFALRWASHSSCQQGRGRGDVVFPSGVVVMNVFSEGRAGRGIGAIMKRMA